MSQNNQVVITLASFIDFPRILLPASPIRLSATSLYDVSFFSQTISFTLRLNTLNPDKNCYVVWV